MALGSGDLDLNDTGKIRESVRAAAPRVIVNAAAYTAVDRAESEPGLAMAVNGIAPSVLAEEAKRCGALLVHYSTDYVFDGRKEGPYTEEDRPAPLNVYGKTKFAGEEGILASGCSFLLFRTSWVYGARGRNFYLAIRRLALEREEIAVVDDQVGAPTWCRAVAESTAMVLAQGLGREEGFGSFFQARSGIYHLTSRGRTSWYGFAKAIVEAIPREERKVTRVLPIRTEDYPSKAQRPLNSVLDNRKIGAVFSVRQPEWTLEL